MDDKSQKRLASILQQDITSLKPHEVAFLKARKSYIPLGVIEKYKEVLSHPIKTRKARVVEQEEMAEVQSPALDLRDYGYKDLQSKASQLGMSKVVGVKKDQLISFIRSNNG